MLYINLRMEKDWLLNDSGEQESNKCIKNKKLKQGETIKKEKAGEKAREDIGNMKVKSISRLKNMVM